MDTLNDVLSSANAQQGMSEQDIIANLIRQQMTSGLTRDANGRLTFSTPPAGTGAEPGSSGAAGYAGPLRASDIPSNTAGADIPVYNGAAISPQTVQARAEAGGPFRGVLPQAQAEQLSQGLSSLPAMGVGPAGNKEIVSGILEKFGLGENKLGDLEKQLLLRSQARAAEKNAAPLGKEASRYVDKETGQRADPNVTYGEVTGKGSKYLALNANQDKQYEALLNLRAHILATAPFLNALPESTSLATGGRLGNKAAMSLNTLANKPENVALNEQLSSMTPIATARTFLGSGGRAGPAAAKMLVESNVTGGDDRQTALVKMRNLQKVATELAKDNHLPTAPFENILKEAGLEGKGKRTDLAPQAAIEALKSNPGLKEQFKQKYGYLPGE